MRSRRDSQQSRVYAWEDRASGGSNHHAVWDSLEECEAFLKPIWRAERGRVGLAKQVMPEFSRKLWGQSNATAGSDHVLKIPKWARSPWVVLHEAAHRLTPVDVAHGPRFVGVLIGLLARHDNRDAAELMALADEMGVKYHVRSIGVVPLRGIAWQLEKTLREQRPMPEMELACWLDVSYLQIRGAAMHLIRLSKARWLRGKLVPQGELLPPPPPAPKAKRQENPNGTKALAKAHGIEIERSGGSYIVWPPSKIEEGDLDDPFDGDHYADDWGAVDLMVRRYVEVLTGAWPRSDERSTATT